jgi:hypothetical protein
LDSYTSQYLSIRSLEYKHILYDIGVPDIELGGLIIFYGQPTRTGQILKKERAGDVGYGKTTGFVTFHTRTGSVKAMVYMPLALYVGRRRRLCTTLPTYQ